jgi:hypothetical protein
MKMVISEYRLVAGLIDSSSRAWINKEIKEKGSAKILIDYYIDGYNGGKGAITPFPFKVSNRLLAKRNELIYLTQRYNTNQLVLRICRIDVIVKGARTCGAAKFFELTVEKPKKIK